MIGNGNNLASIAKPTTPPVDMFFVEEIASTTIDGAHAEGVKDILLGNAAGFGLGTYVRVTSKEGTKFTFFTLVAAPVGNLITIDTPTDSAFVDGDIVTTLNKEMNVDGSVTTRVFAACGNVLALDVSRLMLYMITSGSPTASMFGDIAGGLTNGIVLRRNNDEIDNIFNAKTNGELGHLMFDFNTFDPANPAGVNGISGRFSFTGKDKHDTTIQLKGTDRLEILIQDDLTGLLQFRIMGEGRIFIPK